MKEKLMRLARDIRNSRAVNIALMPVRAPGALGVFVWWNILHWLEERQAKKGTTLDVSSVQARDGLIPDPRRHH